MDYSINSKILLLFLFWFLLTVRVDATRLELAATTNKIKTSDLSNDYVKQVQQTVLSSIIHEFAKSSKTIEGSLNEIVMRAVHLTLIENDACGNATGGQMDDSPKQLQEVYSHERDLLNDMEHSHDSTSTQHGDQDHKEKSQNKHSSSDNDEIKDQEYSQKQDLNKKNPAGGNTVERSNDNDDNEKDSDGYKEKKIDSENMDSHEAQDENDSSSHNKLSHDEDSASRSEDVSHAEKGKLMTSDETRTKKLVENDNKERKEDERGEQTKIEQQKQQKQHTTTIITTATMTTMTTTPPKVDTHSDCQENQTDATKDDQPPIEDLRQLDTVEHSETRAENGTEKSIESGETKDEKERPDNDNHQGSSDQKHNDKSSGLKYEGSSETEGEASVSSTKKYRKNGNAGNLTEADKKPVDKKEKQDKQGRKEHTKKSNASGVKPSTSQPQSVTQKAQGVKKKTAMKHRKETADKELEKILNPQTNSKQYADSKDKMNEKSKRREKDGNDGRQSTSSSSRIPDKSEHSAKTPIPIEKTKINKNVNDITSKSNDKNKHIVETGIPGIYTQTPGETVPEIKKDEKETTKSSKGSGSNKKTRKNLKPKDQEEKKNILGEKDDNRNTHQTLTTGGHTETKSTNIPSKNENSNNNKEQTNSGNGNTAGEQAASESSRAPHHHQETFFPVSENENNGRIEAHSKATLTTQATTTLVEKEEIKVEATTVDALGDSITTEPQSTSQTKITVKPKDEVATTLEGSENKSKLKVKQTKKQNKQATQIEKPEDGALTDDTPKDKEHEAVEEMKMVVDKNETAMQDIAEILEKDEKNNMTGDGDTITGEMNTTDTKNDTNELAKQLNPSLIEKIVSLRNNASASCQGRNPLTGRVQCVAFFQKISFQKERITELNLFKFIYPTPKCAETNAGRCRLEHHVAHRNMGDGTTSPTNCQDHLDNDQGWCTNPFSGYCMSVDHVNIKKQPSGFCHVDAK